MGLNEEVAIQAKLPASTDELFGSRPATALNELPHDLVTNRTNGIPLGIPERNPDLSAQCNNRRAIDERFGDQVLLDVMRENIVISVRGVNGYLLKDIDVCHSGNFTHTACRMIEK